MQSETAQATKRVLVTGHRGYIGVVLTPLLQAQGHEVVGLDSDIFRACSYGEGPTDIPTIEKDVRDVEASDLRGFDAVLHLAALSNDPLGNLAPELTDQINHAASVRLAERAKQAGVQQFVFSSSCSVYGASESEDVVLTEESSLNPVTPYAVSKAQVEAAVGAMADDAFSPTFLRNATAYGLSPRVRFDLVLNNLVAWAFCTGRVHLKSDGRSWRPLVHIEDISRAFAAVLAAPRDRVHGQVFNVGDSRENYRIRDVAQIVADVVPDSEVSFADAAAADRRNYRVNCDKIQEELGYETVWSVRTGAKQLLEGYRTHGLSLEQFEGSRYQRLAHLRELLDAGTLRPDLRFASAAGGAASFETGSPAPRLARLKTKTSPAVRATS